MSQPKFNRECPSHQDEPIIRISLNPSHTKLFYCYECLQNVDKTIQSNLIKFKMLDDKLYEQLSQKYEQALKKKLSISPEKFSINKAELSNKIEESILRQREKVDQEFMKIQEEIIGVLSYSKSNVYGILDKVKTEMLGSLANFLEKVDTVNNISSLKCEISKEDIFSEFERIEKVEEMEKALKKRLGTIKLFDEITQGKMIKALEEEKDRLKNMVDNFGLIYPKDPEFYRKGLKDLNGYFEGLVYRYNGKEMQARNKFIKDQNNARKFLKDEMSGFQLSLKKRSEKIQQYTQDMLELCSPTPLSTTDQQNNEEEVDAQINNSNESIQNSSGVESGHGRSRGRGRLVRNVIRGSRGHDRVHGRGRGPGRHGNRR